MPHPRSKLFPSPEDAENAFYDAFERSDIAAMMTVWAEDDDVVCVHPQGPRLVGFDAVRESWVQIFSGGIRLRVRTTEERHFESQTLAVRAVVEVLSVPNQEGPTSSVCATNVYALTEGGWRMVAHHASPVAQPAPVEEPAPAAHTLH